MVQDSASHVEDTSSAAAALTPRVCYVSSEEARSYADLLPSNKGRSSTVHSLIEALDLLHDVDLEDSDGDQSDHLSESDNTSSSALNRARAVAPVLAMRNDLCRFHNKAYIDALFQASQSAVADTTPDTSLDSLISQGSPKKRMKSNDCSDTTSQFNEKGVSASADDEHGLEHDCPVFPGLEDYCCYTAGGSLAAARELRQGRADIAIHWDGGRHHATKSSASGFCYVNDIVLAILELQKSPLIERKSSLSLTKQPSTPVKRLKKVLYIDLDLHHGDGVAEAFENNANVVTVSLHLWSKGFYPSRPKGHLNYSGPAAPNPASKLCLNVAVPKSGLRDTSFLRLIETCIKPIYEAFKPDVLVLQCGVDGLAGDPCKEFNVSLRGYGQAVLTVLKWCGRASCNRPDTGEAEVDEAKQIPVLLLGGGGYHTTNAARAWAYITTIALGRTLDLDRGTIPETCVQWETFYNDNAAGDGLDVVANAARRDENTEEDLESIEEAFEAYTEALRARTAGS